MRHVRLLLAGVFALLLLGCAAAKPAPLTVMTYNIHHAAGMDKRLDLPRIAAVIKQCNPDLVALQEVDRKTLRTGGVDQTAELGRLTGMHAIFGRAMDYETGQYGDAILTRLNVKSHRVIELPYTQEGKREPRAALEVRCGTPGGDLLFLSTHLDHLGEPSDRLAQVKAIIAALRNEKRPAILAGDFNCKPGSDPLKKLEEDGWMRATDDQPSEPSVSPKAKIDHVFVRPAERWRMLETHVVAETMASDHRPVVVKLELLPAKKSQ